MEYRRLFYLLSTLSIVGSIDTFMSITSKGKDLLIHSDHTLSIVAYVYSGCTLFSPFENTSFHK